MDCTIQSQGPGLQSLHSSVTAPGRRLEAEERPAKKPKQGKAEDTSGTHNHQVYPVFDLATEILKWKEYRRTVEACLDALPDISKSVSKVTVEMQRKTKLANAAMALAELELYAEAAFTNMNKPKFAIVPGCSRLLDRRFTNLLPFLRKSNHGLLDSEEQAYSELIQTATLFACQLRALASEDRPFPAQAALDMLSRWRQINDIVEGKNVVSTQRRTLPSFDYARINKLLEPKYHVHPLRDVGRSALASLQDTLIKSDTHLKNFINGSIDSLVFLVRCVVESVSSLMDDVQIIRNKQLSGRYISASIHVDVVVRRQSSILLVIAVKSGNIRDGMAQAHLACEIAADLYRDTEIHAIATSFTYWRFLHRDSNGCHFNDCAIKLTPSGPVESSVKGITDRIFYVLSSQISTRER